MGFIAVALEILLMREPFYTSVLHGMSMPGLSPALWATVLEPTGESLNPHVEDQERNCAAGSPSALRLIKV